ncbi:MAG: MATE family efflux transporter [Deltaproteobacteria bacterium]|nr:MATE family efflux transporter [Deltaproteobacteria bacterium]
MRSRLGSLLALALPMVLARASQSVITFADAIQVKDLGARAIAATSTGGLNVWAFVILPMGMAFIIQSFVAQLVGRGRRDDTPRFAWYGLALAVIAALVAFAVMPLVGPALSLTGYSPEVRHSMTEYMQIRMLSIGAIVGVEALGNWFGGLGNTWMQMIAGLVTMASAVFLNWVLIGGHLGAPALGVNGAAWASAIASWLGFIVIAIAFWPHRRGAGRLSMREFKRVIRFGLPNGLNWFIEFAAFQLFVNGVMASLGDETVAALNVVLAVNSISFMPAFGLASAGSILAAQSIGAGDKEGVWPSVKLTLVVTLSWMGAIALLYVVASHTVLGWFAPQGAAGVRLIVLGTSMLVVSAAWQAFDGTAMVLSETLRAAGDTAWPAGARIILAWAVFVPSAYLAVHEFGGGPLGAMGCLVGYIALLAILLAFRFRSGAWKRIELIEPDLVREVA